MIKEQETKSWILVTEITERNYKVLLYVVETPGYAEVHRTDIKW